MLHKSEKGKDFIFQKGKTACTTCWKLEIQQKIINK